MQNNRVCAPRLCAALFLSFLFTLPLTAQAEQKIIAVPCPPDAIEIPEGGLRAASDGNTWTFVLAPAANVTIWDQQWTFNGQNPNAPNLNPGWGTFGGGNGSNSFSWISPTQGGSYSIRVKAKRKCAGEGGGGDGPPIDENFQVSWDVEVEDEKTWTTPSPIAASWVAPAANAIVAPSTPVGCSITATDSDHWTKGLAPNLLEGDDPDDLVYNWSASGGTFRGSGASTQFIPPNATGSYAITCVIDDEPKLLGTLDTGTRDDAPVTLTRTVVVPPRHWTADTPITVPLDAKGAPLKDEDNIAIQNGRMIAPQNQIEDPPDPANPKIIKVRPGVELSCLLEAATDWDKWTRAGLDVANPSNFNLTFGHAEDEVKYSWSASGGSWKNNATSHLAATWIAPALVAGANIYTLTCALNDKPKAVNLPDTGVRDDAAITRTVQVQVVDDTSWMSLKLHRKGTANEPGEEIAGPCGGDVVIAVEIQVGGKSKLVVPPAGAGIGSGQKIRVTEHDGLDLHDESDNHAYWDVPLGAVGAWQKWENNAWQNSNELPIAENDGPAPIRYRALLDWTTTASKTSADPDGADENTLQAGKLWGHNSSHSLALEYSVKVGNEWQIKHEAEFQSKDANGEYEAARTAGPNVIGADVQNLIVTGVEGSGNPDYIKFDPTKDLGTPLRNPKIKFKIEDGGDHETNGAPHRYDYWVTLYKTIASDGTINSDFAVMIKGMAVAGQSVEVTVNDPVKVGAGGDEWQDAALMDWGTYAFDIMVQEKRSGIPAEIDIVPTMRSQLIGIPLTMPGVVDEEGDPRPGHDLDGWSTLDTDFEYYASLYLNGGNSGLAQGQRNASDVRIDFVNPNLDVIAQLTGSKKPQLLTKGTPNLDLEYYTPTDDDEAGEYRGVFSVADSYKEIYRNHQDHRMLAVNAVVKPVRASNYHWLTEVIGRYRADKIAANYQNNVPSFDRQRLVSGYIARGWGNEGSSKVLQQLPKDRITFIYSHGLTSGSALKHGSGKGLVGTTSTTTPNFNGSSVKLDSISTKAALVVYAACYSSKKSTLGHGDLLKITVAKGAKTAIGFEKFIDISYQTYAQNHVTGNDTELGKFWTDAFWRALCRGTGESPPPYAPVDVADALDYALKQVKDQGDGSAHQWDSFRIHTNGGLSTIAPIVR